MYAVVQIGSMIFRSECITTRSVVSAATGAGAPAAPTSASAQAMDVARVRFMELLLARGRDPACSDKTIDPGKLSTHPIRLPISRILPDSPRRHMRQQSSKRHDEGGPRPGAGETARIATTNAANGAGTRAGAHDCPSS